MESLPALLFGASTAANLAGVLALTFLLALAAALVATPLAKRLARAAGAIDMPEARRIHSVPTPRWGGLAVIAAGLLSLLATTGVLAGARAQLEVWGAMVPAIAAGALLLLMVGLVDDCKSVSPWIKLAAETAAAALVVFAGCRVHTLLGFDLGSLSIPVTIIWIVAVINAFNMVDGLDGLAAGLALMISSTLIVLSLEASENGAALVLASLCGGLLGFLWYNFNPASIFLGDSGSLSIGFLLGVVSALTSGKGSTAATVIVPVLALGLPLAELSVTTLRRLLRVVNVVRSTTAGEYHFRFAGKAALFTADRDHIHHRLLALGLSQREATLLLYSACVVVNAGALALLWRRPAYEGILPIAAATALIVCIRTLGYRELQPMRNGLFLPLFPAKLLELRSLQIPADFALSLLSLIGAYQIHTLLGQDWPSWKLLGQLAVAQTGFLALGGLYARSQPFASVQGAIVIARSLFYAALATGFLSAMMVGSPFHSFETAIVDMYLFATLIIGYRISFYLLDHIFINARPMERRVLIYGTDEAATAALHTILGSPYLQMKVVGFLEEGSLSQTSYQGLRVLGSDAFNAGSRDFDEIILPGTIPDKLLKRLSIRCKLANLQLKRLSVDCTDVDPPAQGRELSEVVARGAS
jgi:UDP-GlcNAc:undecaprenyl-phosphate GlcNAc-1-phosphate transferase